MQRLFDLIEKHKDELLNYNAEPFYQTSREIAQSGLAHVPGDFLVYIETWDRLLAKDLSEGDIVSRVFPNYLQVGLAFQAIFFSYVTAKPESIEQDFRQKYLGLALEVDREILDPSKGVWYSKEKLRDKAGKLVQESGYSAEKLAEWSQFILRDYEQFFATYGRDYKTRRYFISEEFKTLGKEIRKLAKLLREEKITSKVYDSQGQILFDRYMERPEDNFLKLVPKMASYQRSPIRDLCEILDPEKDFGFFVIGGDPLK